MSFNGMYATLVPDTYGDGLTDARAPIQLLIDEAAAAGGGVVFIPAGTYLLKRPLYLASGVTLLGAGRGATTLTKPATVKSLLTANATTGSTSVAVTDATGFQVGAAIHLSDTTNYEWLSTQGRITAIEGNTITFVNDERAGTTGCEANYNTSRAATAYTSMPLIRNELASSNIAVRDLTLDQNTNADDPADDFTIAPIHWAETYYSTVEDCDIIDACGDAYSDQANAYGVVGSNTTKNTIRGCRIRGAGRHGIHLGSDMIGGFVLDNEVTDCGGFGFFYCASVTHTVARGNIFENVQSGFAGIDTRDSANVIADNVVKGWSLYAIDASGTEGEGTTPGRLTITGNVLVDTGSGNSGGINLNQPGSVVANNHVDMGSSGGIGIQLGALADRCVVDGNVVVSAGGASSIGIGLGACDDARLTSNTVTGSANGMSATGATRMVAVGNSITGTSNRVWWLGAGNTDCRIDGHQGSGATAVTEDAAQTRLLFNGLGTNGTTDPASGGDWNSITGTRWNGTMVRWNSGGGEKVSIYYSGVGWTALN